MSATAVVLLVLRIEAVALALAALAIIGYAVRSRYARRRRRTRIAHARSLLAEHLENLALPAERVGELRALTRSELARLFFDVAQNVGTRERTWLRNLAAQLGLLAAAQRQTRSRRWWIRLRAARLLTLIGGADDDMRRLLDDPVPAVRAQAASHVAEHPDDAGITRIIAMLTDHAAVCRFAARDALMRMAGRAAPAVREHLMAASDAATLQLLDVACSIASYDMLPAAFARSRDERPAARVLAARLLRGIGGPVAAARLVEMLEDSSSEVREAATESIGFLNHWPAASAAARRLEDPESRVRLAAAVALERMGPPGELLLRHALARGSQQAGIAARRVLAEVTR